MRHICPQEEDLKRLMDSIWDKMATLIIPESQAVISEFGDIHNHMAI